MRKLHASSYRLVSCLNHICIVASTTNATNRPARKFVASTQEMMQSFQAFLHKMIPEQLLQQHQLDLETYQRAHLYWWNRVLHWILIPCETTSFFLLLVVLSHHLSFLLGPIRWSNPLSISFLDDIGQALGMLSLVLAVVVGEEDDDDDDTTSLSLSFQRWTIGILACLYHINVVPWCDKRVDQWGRFQALAVALALWTGSWAIQVGVGHYWIEQNQPNVADMSSVSYLAMVTSIVIAWKP